MNSIQKYALIWLVILPFIGAVLFINPLRESALEDDWAYSRSVQHLLNTGNYKIDNWLAANPIFQIYWGAFWAKLLGYSFATLRVSTLIFVFAGLIAFYYLAKEHELDNFTASLVTLGLFASPLALRFSFNYMTDMPFLACSMVALWLYSRAMRLLNYRLMFLASVAASAAILIRQFGLALLLAIICVWIIGKERRVRTPFFITGLILPGLATVLQIQAGSLTPNWAALYVVHMQQLYFSTLMADPIAALLDSVWRLSVIFQYMAFFALPFIGIILIDSIHKFCNTFVRTEYRESAKLPLLILAAASVFVLMGIVISQNRGVMLMPFLPWYFGDMERLLSFIVTLITSIGAIIIFYLIAFRYLRKTSLPELSTSKQVLDFVTLFFMAQLLIFYKIGDEYLLVLFPYFLIVMGRYIQEHLEKYQYKIAAIAALFVFLGVSSLWTRSILSESEARWSAAEIALTSGTTPEQINQGWIWNSYYGMFDQYLMVENNRNKYDVMDFFYNWVPAYTAKSKYRVTNIIPIVGWQVVTKIPYQNFWLGTEYVYLLQHQE